MTSHTLVGCAFLLGALFHAIQIEEQLGFLSRDDRPFSISCAQIRRHILFILVDGIFATLVFLDVWWTYIPLTCLLLQQAWSHGQEICQSARERRVDWLGIVAMVTLTVCLLVLFFSS
jgi:hypothetical protein